MLHIQTRFQILSVLFTVTFAPLGNSCRTLKKQNDNSLQDLPASQRSVSREWVTATQDSLTKLQEKTSAMETAAAAAFADFSIGPSSTSLDKQIVLLTGLVSSLDIATQAATDLANILSGKLVDPSSQSLLIPIQDTTSPSGTRIAGIASVANKAIAIKALLRDNLTITALKLSQGSPQNRAPAYSNFIQGVSTLADAIREVQAALVAWTHLTGNGGSPQDPMPVVFEDFKPQSCLQSSGLELKNLEGLAAIEIASIFTDNYQKCVGFAAELDRMLGLLSSLKQALASKSVRIRIANAAPSFDADTNTLTLPINIRTQSVQFLIATSRLLETSKITVGTYMVGSQVAVWLVQKDLKNWGEANQFCTGLGKAWQFPKMGDINSGKGITPDFVKGRIGADSQLMKVHVGDLHPNSSAYIEMLYVTSFGGIATNGLQADGQNHLSACVLYSNSLVQ